MFSIILSSYLIIIINIIFIIAARGNYFKSFFFQESVRKCTFILVNSTVR